MVGFLALLVGCGGDKAPSGPGGSIPPFTVWLSDTAITPPENVQVKLVVTFPNDFNNLDSRRVYFNSSSQGGFFNNDSSYVNVQLVGDGYLNPSVWYGYNGSQHDFIDTVTVTVVDLYYQTLAWNYGTILVH